MIKRCPHCNSRLPLAQSAWRLGSPFRCHTCGKAAIIEHNPRIGYLAAMIVIFSNMTISDRRIFYSILIIILFFTLYLYIFKNKPISIENYILQYPNSKIAREFLMNNFHKDSEIDLGKDLKNELDRDR
jgi:hypothetical protein